MLCKFKKQCSSKPFLVQNKISTHVFLSPRSSPGRCAQHRSSSISIKWRKISACCFVYELLNVKTFALHRNHLPGRLLEINLCCLLTARTNAASSWVTALSSFTCPRAETSSQTMQEWSAANLTPEVISKLSQPMRSSSVRYVTDVCMGMLRMERWWARQLGMEERDGFRDETKGGRAAGVATAEESSSCTDKQINIKWLEGNSHGVAFSESSWTQRAGVNLHKSVSPPANLQCLVPFSTALDYFLFSM